MRCYTESYGCVVTPSHSFNNVDSLLDGLRRFVISEGIAALIASPMKERPFYVDDAGARSEIRAQHSGITQGCTLSPLLFIVVMSALMYDAHGMLSADARAAYDRGDLADIAYADDTLLLGVSSQHLSEYLSAVAAAGNRYGMELHYQKFQLVNVRCDTQVWRPDGEAVDASNWMSYLGTVLAEDGHVGTELSRWIGRAKSDFKILSKVWNHSCLSRKREVAFLLLVVALPPRSFAK